MRDFKKGDKVVRLTKQSGTNFKQGSVYELDDTEAWGLGQYEKR